ncbi:MAG: hypothetical protein K8S13_03170 [Desulfobacula sp.]|uniref:hypothetical protein n=1 Tax=Desulfobacula sp. TaxID=2593537 RepID=UPI0025BEB51F|nr:hypothetical protein [Desulfobacula sp.]MCD4718845.1 hypothetical protein [Desulfobacula sp.]
MTILLTPQYIGNVEIKNRFVHSATYEGMADSSGRITDQLIKRYQTIAKGAVGTIIPDNMPVIIKLNTCDYTPKEGITHSIAVKYAE